MTSGVRVKGVWAVGPIAGKAWRQNLAGYGDKGWTSVHIGHAEAINGEVHRPSYFQVIERRDFGVHPHGRRAVRSDVPLPPIPCLRCLEETCRGPSDVKVVGLLLLDPREPRCIVFDDAEDDLV